MKWSVFVVALTILCSCENKKNEASNGDKETSLSCKGIYYTRDSQGNLLKFNQFWSENQKACLTDNLPLSQWEKSSESWAKNKVQCKPQPTFPPVTFKAANNFYQYRDSRLYIDFDSSSGKFRRLIIGEDKNGKVVFQRDMACFYAREDHEVEPVNSRDYDKQLLLDLEVSASSSTFTPMEIFKYQTDNMGNWFLTRFDDVSTWDFKFCPEDTTEWSYCNAMRGGNYIYHPENLDTTTKAALTIEAKLIRTQFNYTEMAKTEFESLWAYHEKNNTEIGIGGDWKYHTQHVPDIVWYLDRSWRDYLIGNRPAMPDVYMPSIPQVCYSGSQNVTLANGNTGRVYGEVCYVNGTYIFTQQ